MTRDYIKRKNRDIPVLSGSLPDILEKNDKKAKRNFEELL